MKMSRVVSLALLLCTLTFTISAGIAAAETTKVNGARVSLWFPDHWSMDKKGSQLIISDPAGEVVLAFMTVSGKNLEDAMEKLGDELDKFVSDVDVTNEGEDIEVNGMKGSLFEAKGVARKKRVDVSMAIFARPNNQFLVLFGIVESSKLEKHTPVLQKVLNSLRPL